jgi:C4-dicarboxylate transporter DctM subunit
VSGSSAATCAIIGKISLPELKKRGYPEDISIGTLAGASTLGLLIPPSIIMIVYGVAANVSIAKLFIAGVIPGLVLAALFSGYIIVWALFNKDKVPQADAAMSFAQKIYEGRKPDPRGVVDCAGAGFHLLRHCHCHRGCPRWVWVARCCCLALSAR